MTLFRSKFGLIFSLSYLAIFLLSGMYAIYMLVFHTANSEFSGVLAILVTLPWSLIFAPVMDALGIIAWYGRFASHPVIYGLCATMTLLPGALLNATILYFVGKLFDHDMKHKA